MCIMLKKNRGECLGHQILMPKSLMYGSRFNPKDGCAHSMSPGTCGRYLPQVPGLPMNPSSPKSTCY